MSLSAPVEGELLRMEEEVEADGQQPSLFSTSESNSSNSAASITLQHKRRARVVMERRNSMEPGRRRPVLSQAMAVWCVKYFWEGQSLQTKVESAKADPNASWVARHRRLVAMCLPAFLAHVGWWAYMFSKQRAGGVWSVFSETSGENDIPNWYLTVTMVFGSMVAGATSEGGAAVAFPVMTLLFGIAPGTARDFSYMIQSAGMTAASLTILIMGIRIEKRALLYGTIGGAAGIVFGLEQVAPRLTPPYSKMYFVCIWAAFAVSLYWLNKLHDRPVFDGLPGWQGRATNLFTKSNWWRGLVLLSFGFLGGIFSAMSGSGLDICSFACLTLLFRVSEKIATPTSVLLMAGNTMIGFAYREFGMEGGIANDAWSFFVVCVPVVVMGAPLGALVGSHFHRLVLAAAIYVTDLAQLVGALVVVRPWSSRNTDTPIHLTVTSAAILVGGALFFGLLAKAGQRLLVAVERDEPQQQQLVIQQQEGRRRRSSDDDLKDCVGPSEGWYCVGDRDKADSEAVREAVSEAVESG